MGYRSEVAISFDEHHAKILEKICSQDKDFEEFVREGQERIETGVNRNYSSLRYSYIKWYDSYDEVSKMDNFLEQIDEESYHFIRLGEDFDDTETRGYLDSGLYINRSIEQW